ncbi:MAG: DNA polymerase II large subunit [Candidatus Heimdallarchaeota archaeon]|nr:DNA polymerase II large subunit [Candidatus Heimdallarchaeota archaeon]
MVNDTEKPFALEASPLMQKYFIQLKINVEKALEIANSAKRKGFDPLKEVEIFIAEDVATRTEGLVGPVGVAKRLKEMERNSLSKDEIVVAIAKEIANGKFFSADPEILAESALRAALSYQTEGITAAPIEGISRVTIKNNPDGTEYLAIYYAGPIRSAGGTAQGLSVMVGDIIRKELGLDRYKATPDEIERILEEVRLYDRIMSLQLFTTDEEIKFAWKNLPVMISGEPTEKEEVGGYRNIESMDTNRVRGGACLVINDGLVGRAKKIMKRIKKLKIDDWDWLNEIASKKFRKTKEIDNIDTSKIKRILPEPSFANDLLMGRPNFSDPTAIGGFRLRYGHARSTGIAAIGLHPGTLGVVNDFLATGTHIRTERPGKGGIVTPIDTIKPPIVLLKDGEVREIRSYEEGKNLFSEIVEIIFIGDILIGYGEFIQNDYNLCPSGYVSEWWQLDFNSAIIKNNPQNLPDIYTPNSVQDAYKLSVDLHIPLHPRYTFAWKYITPIELNQLYDSLSETSISLDYKFIFEKLLIPHKIKQDKLVMTDEILDSLLLQLDLGKDRSSKHQINPNLSTLANVNVFSQVEIKDIIGTTVGARMGRPEKAKERKMKPALHGLFPLGENKDVGRRFSRALKVDELTVQIGNKFCHNCETPQIYNYCLNCNLEVSLIGHCVNPKCRKQQEEGPCDFCGYPVKFLKSKKINLKEILQVTQSRIGRVSQFEAKFLEKVKNPTGTIELLDKGILRSNYDLHVFRDGTIRYDATDAPLTHFYPHEIKTSIAKLLEIGYHEDIDGNPLENENQLIELRVQDIVLHTSAITYLLNITKFVDDELEKIYKLEKYYNCKLREDLIGHLLIGLAPHTSAGVVGRIIGFSDASVCWAHPYWHSAKRRNCDGDEDGIIMLMDGFLNFSKQYLPMTRGSRMDTPLVLVTNLNPKEVDDEAFNVEVVSKYPKDLYLKAEEIQMPGLLSDKIERIEARLGTEKQFEKFYSTHKTSSIVSGPRASKYKDSSLTFREKLHLQLELAQKIRAVDAQQTALKILERHVLPDLVGNLRAFGSQKFRCVTCNTKYRRLPLRGKCLNTLCHRSNLVLTVSPKGVTKYFDICKMLIEDYKLPQYHLDRLEKIQISIDSHFPNDSGMQLDLSEWF